MLEEDCTLMEYFRRTTLLFAVMDVSRLATSGDSHLKEVTRNSVKHRYGVEMNSSSSKSLRWWPDVVRESKFLPLAPHNQLKGLGPLDSLASYYD